MAFHPERDKGTMISLHSSFGLSVDKGVSSKRQTGFCSKEKRTRNEIKRTQLKQIKIYVFVSFSFLRPDREGLFSKQK